ncbi:hypothetical protein HXX76_011859 [Chlamydomonas incerta]|uniref:Uncharacterized protein n=1 Tax=Chlamydomonas incerta TaxID=51695 RepID=A0A835STU8_CHLIN|nr:hypothetical protein HXX76_011859 [Chlamydomonas incerta]|eukprot:KAG2428179.1 hypothetical protein HXX76_011859 [Chlamydomonas incerta]
MLAALRHGPLMLGLTADLDADSDDDDLSAEADELVLDFEEDGQGHTGRSGPMELVVLRAPALPKSVQAQAKGLDARYIAMTQGLKEGLKAGCQAVLLVVVKATAVIDDVWQALAAGISLARANAGGGHSGCPAVPVHVVLTDASSWYFMAIQATAPAVEKAVDAGSGASAFGGGAAAGGGATAVGGGATASGGATAGVQVASATGLDFVTRNGETFRLFNFSFITAPVIQLATPVSDVLKVMYRLYTALYPDEDIAHLPAAVREGEKLAKKAAREWVASRMQGLKAEAAAIEEAVRAKQEAEARAERAEREAAAYKERAQLEADARVAAQREAAAFKEAMERIQREADARVEEAVKRAAGGNRG